MRAIASSALIFVALAAGHAQSRSFEVASIRPHEGLLSRGDFRVSIPAAASQVAGIYYDVVAKAEGDATPSRDDFRQLLQSLLADRFKLRAHRVLKEIPVYALIAGRNGPTFKKSSADAVPSAHFGPSGSNQKMNLIGASMEVAGDIQELSFADRPFVDKTGLTGTYDITFETTPKDGSVFADVQQQLGLRLEPQKASVDVLVVDHIEKPSEN